MCGWQSSLMEVSLSSSPFPPPLGSLLLLLLAASSSDSFPLAMPSSPSLGAPRGLAGCRLRGDPERERLQ